MIKINGAEFKPGMFPDGTSELLNVPINVVSSDKIINIFWHYANDAEFLNIVYLVNHYRSKFGRDVEYNLYMPYIPNARMDRVKSDNEVFTLKWFAKLINSLQFDNVYVIDPHSDVSVALIDNVIVWSSEQYIKKVINSICEIYKLSDNDLLIYFPDAGAYKRYKDMSCFAPFKKMYGQKVRDWNTGKILGLTIVNEAGEEIPDTIYGCDYETKGLNPEIENSETRIAVPTLKGKSVLMVDDIISYGGTFYYSALKLNKMGPDNIFAYATHTEPKSLWNKEKGTFIKSFGFDGNKRDHIKQIVEKLYTTDSIYNLESNDFVNVQKCF